MKKVNKVYTLTVAGSDSSSGAGIQADLRTFIHYEIDALTTITAITAQGSVGVTHVQIVEKETISMQLKTVFESYDIKFIKIGMLGNIEIVKEVVRILEQYKTDDSFIIFDTVMLSSSGYILLSKEAIKYAVKNLFPIVDLITPNIPEAEYLTGIKIKDIEDMKKACIEIKKLSLKNILLKGGHLDNNSNKTSDIFYDGEKFKIISHERLKAKNTHGTGCTLSSAILANIVNGFDIVESIENSIEYLQEVYS